MSDFNTIRSLHTTNLYGEPQKDLGPAVLVEVMKAEMSHPDSIEVTFKYAVRHQLSMNDQNTLDAIDEKLKTEKNQEMIDRLNKSREHLTGRRYAFIRCLYDKNTGNIHPSVTMGKDSKSKLLQNLKEVFLWAKRHEHSENLSNIIEHLKKIYGGGKNAIK